jgi:hypothetical protein
MKLSDALRDGELEPAAALLLDPAGAKLLECLQGTPAIRHQATTCAQLTRLQQLAQIFWCNSNAVVPNDGPVRL